MTVLDPGHRGESRSRCHQNTPVANDTRWSWVDLKEGIIEIPEEITKTGEPQTLPLSDELINMLKKQFRQDDAPVFDTTNFRKEFQRACVAAGLGKTPKWFQRKVTNGTNTRA